MKALADVRWEGSGGFASSVFEGDPAKPGMYTMVVKLADGFWITPHWHPEAKRVVVLSGTLLMGSGAAFDKATATALAPGGFSVVPPHHVHFEGAKGETILLFTGCGPLATTFVDTAGVNRPQGGKQ
jgi:oxalate decarboxylase/phosphoglucose isomerase-like protein (cupin superfamily)